MALWDHERAILDQLDAGLSPHQVAARGFTLAQVKRVTNTIGTARMHADADRRRADNMRLGSQALLRALQAAGAQRGAHP